MVYCTKCGTENEEEASNCVNCGVPLQTSSFRTKDWEEEFEGRVEDFGERAEEFGKRMEDECFGLPGGNSIIGIIIGIVIILVGASTLLDWNIDFGPFVMIVIGILIVAGALYQRSQRKT